MEIDDVDALLAEPHHTALGVDGVADDDLLEAELVDHAAAIPAGSEGGDEDGVAPGGAAAGGAEGVGFAVERAVAFLHEAVMAGTEERAVRMKDGAPHGNAAFGQSDASLFQRDCEHGVSVRFRRNYGRHAVETNTRNPLDSTTVPTDTGLQPAASRHR